MRTVPRSWWPWLRALGGAAILAFLVWRLGSGPFLAGLRMIDGWAVAAALGIGAVTTTCSAWRWRRVAAGLGVGLSMGTAVAYLYRAIFLNATLPGGVLGDVHRAVRHGRDVGDVGRSVRAVVWERASGQAVTLAVSVVILLALPSPVRTYLPLAAGLAVVTGLALWLLARAIPRGGQSRQARALRTAASDMRNGLFARGRWPGLLFAATIVIAGHLATFLIAARTAGATAPLTRLLPLTLLAFLAMAVPLNVAGFGPREGVAAWVFGAAGLTAAEGVASATIYGILVLIGSLPGAAALFAYRPRTGPPAEVPAPPSPTALSDAAQILRIRG